MATNTLNLRVSLAYARKPDAQLLNFADTIGDQLYGNTHFPAPPIAVVDYEAVVTDFRDRLAEQKENGPAGTARKNEARVVLLAKLKELALYVQVASANVLSVLLSSGYEPVNSNRASSPLPAPAIDKLVHGQSGEVLLTAKAVHNARGYERQMTTVAADGTPGEWANLGFYKGCRRLSTTGLTAGQRYALRIRAMGGSTDQSDWSEAATIMAL